VLSVILIKNPNLSNKFLKYKNRRLIVIRKVKVKEVKVRRLVKKNQTLVLNLNLIAILNRVN
jgi:hypothetical protein